MRVAASSGRKLLQLFSHRAGPDGKIEGFGHPDDGAFCKPGNPLFPQDTS